MTPTVKAIVFEFLYNGTKYCRISVRYLSGFCTLLRYYSLDTDNEGIFINHMLFTTSFCVLLINGTTT